MDNWRDPFSLSEQGKRAAERNPPRCYYDPRDLGFTPVGDFVCPVCGAKSYWRPTQKDSEGEIVNPHVQPYAPEPQPDFDTMNTTLLQKGS